MSSQNGAGFNVPSEFVQRLLNNAKGYRELFRSVVEARIPARAKEDVLAKAVVGGLAEASTLLQIYTRGIGDGLPRFFKSHRAPAQLEIHLTDGRTCFSFYASVDASRAVDALPVNVYFEPPDETYLTLNADRLRAASAEINEFFEFIKSLREARDCVSYRLYNACFELYFCDKAKAYELLAKLRGKAARKRDREETFRKLTSEGVVRGKDGFLIYHCSEIYYVTDRGEVYKLPPGQDVSVRETVLRLARGGKSRGLTEVRDNDELRCIAKRLKEICPQLALVMLP